MPSLLFALLSIGLQLSAAYLALRLVRTSGYHFGWIALTSGLTLMAIRRAVEIYFLLQGGLEHAQLTAGEFIGVGNAALLFIGTLGIKTFFEKAQRDAEGLVESEARSRAMLDALPDICFCLDSRGVVQFFDSKEHATSFEAERAVGRQLEDAELPPELVVLLRRMLKDTLRDRRGMQQEIVLSLEGELRVREVRTNPSGEDEVLFLVRDITHQKSMEERLQDQLAFGDALLNAIPLPVFYKNRDGRYLGCNRAFADFVGQLPEAIEGHKVEDIFRPDLAERYRSADEELFRHGGSQIYEAWMWCAGRKEDREVRFIKATFGNEGQGRAGLVGVMEDITERKRSEQTLRYAQKMESLGVMAGGVAHDFNNLFQAIQGNLEVAQLLGAQEGVPAQALDRALVAVGKAAQLAKRMLEYSGRVEGSMESLNLAQLLLEREARLAALVTSRIRLSLELPAEPARVMGNQQDLVQVISGLVANAGESYGDAAGRVEVVLGNRRLESLEAMEGFWAEPPPEGASLCLEIRDTGCGMSLSEQNRMFDPFYTTKEVGRGLGLPSSLGIIRAHRAGLQVLSAPGRGTTVRILFRQQDGDAEVALRASSIPAHTGDAILLVDDELVVRQGVAELIRRGLGRDVFEAQDGDEAMAVLAAQGPRIGFVLMDASMPRETGMEVFERIRQVRPDLQGLLCSGYSGTFGQEAATKHGFVGFLPKPFGFKELKKALEGRLPPL